MNFGWIRKYTTVVDFLREIRRSSVQISVVVPDSVVSDETDGLPSTQTIASQRSAALPEVSLDF